MLGAVLGVFVGAGSTRAEHVDFVVDSSNSYLTLAIPNFLYSGASFNLNGQNRTNGAPLATAWSSTTGNTAFVSGSFSTTIGGSLSGGTINSVQFIAGSSTMTALTSGNFRPNPAAFNSAAPVPNYNNNSPHAADYGGVVHSATFANAAYFSLSSSTVDLETTNPVSVVTNQFPVNLVGNSLITGLSTTLFGLQGGNVPLLGTIIPNQLTPLSGLSQGDVATGMGNFVLGSSGNPTTLTIPISVPFSIPIGGGIFLNGTATGQVVASAVPEPSTLGLAGLAGTFVAVWMRRRQRAGVCRTS
jgi:hypothetical protein